MSLLNLPNLSKLKVSSPKSKGNAQAPKTVGGKPVSPGVLAELALKTIHDGVIITDPNGIIRFINPAALSMTGVKQAEDALNLDFMLVMKFETTDGTKVDDANNELMKAVKTNIAFETRKYVLVAANNEKKTPVALMMTPSGDSRSNRIITFRNITKDLEQEGAQMEFISTASHEMRTPVASIEGYLGLALNPQTATIDARARQYLESAHSASQRLGNLFKDLLDVTKLEDKRLKVRPVPIELTGFVKKFADEYAPKYKEKNISYSFGAGAGKSSRFNVGKVLGQTVYAFVDVDFLGEILANLIENAIKYTPEGGALWVNVQGDGDRALINVTDTGIGIAAEDLQHIFQKFYRADNSQTRTVGGTGLGLYLVKQRVEAMDGRVWAESAFGEGSTFYVSLPRLSADEYEKRQIAVRNRAAVQAFQETALTNNIAGNAAGTTTLNAPQAVAAGEAERAQQMQIEAALNAYQASAENAGNTTLIGQTMVAQPVPQPQTGQPIVQAQQPVVVQQPAAAQQPAMPQTAGPAQPMFNPALLQQPVAQPAPQPQTGQTMAQAQPAPQQPAPTATQNQQNMIQYNNYGGQ
ncbi:PAS domain-containing protein [Candidatus Saccharibacteria bacterium]|nr:PAS domain-containing protein [Candidatus Saccharibacteria bacterium]